VHLDSRTVRRQRVAPGVLLHRHAHTIDSNSPSLKKTLFKSSPRKRGSSKVLYQLSLDSRIRGN